MVEVITVPKIHFRNNRSNLCDTSILIIAGNFCQEKILPILPPPLEGKIFILYFFHTVAMIREDIVTFTANLLC